MDEYLKHRKKKGKGLLSLKINIQSRKSKPKTAVVASGEKKPITLFHRKKNMKEKESMDEDIEQYQELEDELEEVEVDSKGMSEEALEHKKEGVVKRFFNFFTPSDKEEEEPMEEAPETLDDDVKEVLKISLKWIEHLPRHKLKEFRESEDFQKYKDVLIKHGLVKEVEKK